MKIVYKGVENKVSQWAIQIGLEIMSILGRTRYCLLIGKADNLLLGLYEGLGKVSRVVKTHKTLVAN